MFHPDGSPGTELIGLNQGCCYGMSKTLLNNAVSSPTGKKSWSWSPCGPLSGRFALKTNPLLFFSICSQGSFWVRKIILLNFALAAWLVERRFTTYLKIAPHCSCYTTTNTSGLVISKILHIQKTCVPSLLCVICICSLAYACQRDFLYVYFGIYSTSVNLSAEELIMSEH